MSLLKPFSWRSEGESSRLTAGNLLVTGNCLRKGLSKAMAMSGVPANLSKTSSIVLS